MLRSSNGSPDARSFDYFEGVWKLSLFPRATSSYLKSDLATVLPSRLSMISMAHLMQDPLTNLEGVSTVSLLSRSTSVTFEIPLGDCVTKPSLNYK